MPSLPRLRNAALTELANQLRFESPEAAHRQLDRTEQLTLEVLAESAATSFTSAARRYPLDYIIFRITGMRSDATPPDGQPALLTADELLADLPALAERLSVAAHLTAAELLSGDHTASKRSPRDKLAGARRAASIIKPSTTTPAPTLLGPWFDLKALSARWRIGAKTIERLRRRGLLARRVRLNASGRGAAARQGLLFSEAAIRAFESSGRFRPNVTSAARTPRLTPAEHARILRRAAHYRRRFGWTLNRCAERLVQSGATTRSLETVRRTLRNHDAAAATPLFSEPAPLDASAQASLDRARRGGASATALARQASRSRGTIYRIERRQRAERLRTLALAGPVGPMFERADASEVLLGPATVCTGLGERAPATIADFLALAEAMQPPTAVIERMRAVAICYLRHRAALALAALPRHRPTVASLDRIETDLRWASRLKAELVRSQLPTALRSLRARLDGRGPEALGSRGPALIHDCIGALIEAVDRFDPFKALAVEGAAGVGGRLAAPATIAVNRALTRWLQRAESTGRPVTSPALPTSTAAHRISSAALDDWSLRVDPWQAWLEPPASLATRLRAGDALTTPPTSSDALLRARFGLGAPGGPPPQTLEHLARIAHTTPTRLASLERRTLAAAAKASSR